MISVVIIDDEVLARIGIKTFLESNAHIRINGCFATAKEALDYLRRFRNTDIVITDIEMAQMSGLELIEEIKKHNLAAGTIIVSCHNDFEYARRAMKLGADGYILKQEITREELIKEIEKVYQTHSECETEQTIGEQDIQDFVSARTDGKSTYQLGVIKILHNYDEAGNIVADQINESMLTGLIESIVSRYEDAYLFVPLQKEMFMIFQFDPEEMEKQKTKMEDISYELHQNILLYINKTLVVGASSCFKNLEEVQSHYKEALSAVKLSFYDEDEKRLYYEAKWITRDVSEKEFDTDRFPDEGGVEYFAAELFEFMDQCALGHADIELVKQNLAGKVNIFVYRVLQQCHLTDELAEKWTQKSQLYQMFTEVDNKKILNGRLIKIMEELQQDVLTQLRQDEFSDVFRYLDKNLAGKISLIELAEMNSMSTASFCKKFKERTGMTLIQYINQRKIEGVKEYLRKGNVTLGEIAEWTGFCNENYMVRVFKKTTGQTVKEFKKGR